MSIFDRDNWRDIYSVDNIYGEARAERARVEDRRERELIREWGKVAERECLLKKEMKARGTTVLRTLMRSEWFEPVLPLAIPVRNYIGDLVMRETEHEPPYRVVETAGYRSILVTVQLCSGYLCVGKVDHFTEVRRAQAPAGWENWECAYGD